MTILAGNIVKIRVTFKDENGVKRDPADVTVVRQKPTGSPETFIYGTDPEVVKESTGIYYLLNDTTGNVGDWEFVWSSTGTYQAVGETSFTVRAAII